jgi:pimeloyl-ACP methyl ester carboxylesterase
MAKQHHVIYLPGIGDHRPRGQDAIIKKWKLYGLNAHYFFINWIDKEPFAPKLKRMVELVDDLAAKGHTVSLVGISAGASAAVNVYCERPDKISGVVFICGKLTGSRKINPNYYRNNPAFYDSLEQAQKSLEKLSADDKKKMLSLHAIFDEVVYTRYTKVPGIASRTVPSFLHIPTIFLAITIYKNLTINFLKWRAKTA